jgi:hypothetical protein
MEVVEGKGNRKIEIWNREGKAFTAETRRRGERQRRMERQGASMRDLSKVVWVALIG